MVCSKKLGHIQNLIDLFIFLAMDFLKFYIILLLYIEVKLHPSVICEHAFISEYLETKFSF